MLPTDIGKLENQTGSAGPVQFTLNNDCYNIHLVEVIRLTGFVDYQIQLNLILNVLPILGLLFLPAAGVTGNTKRNRRNPHTRGCCTAILNQRGLKK